MGGKDPNLDEPEEDPRIDERLRQRLEGMVPDLLRRTLYAGVGAVFTTEEGVRKLAKEVSLPKDMANYLFEQAQTSKNELFRIVAGEMREFLENLNLTDELLSLLTSLSFEVKTEIRFIPNAAQKPRPKIKSSVSMKRKAKEDELADEELPDLEEVKEEEVKEEEE